MIVDLLREPRATPPEKLPNGEDRRTARRWNHATMAWLTSVDNPGTAKTQAFVLNISLTGIGLRCTGPVNVGEGYEIDIGTGPLKLHAKVRVANCRPRNDGTFDVGGSFF